MGRAHSNAWRQVGRFFELPLTPVMRVLCGRSQPAAAVAAERLGWNDHSGSWQDVVVRPDVDLVDICTPGDLHLPIAKAAAAAGKAILCEKPLANSVSEAEQMVASVGRAGVAHMVCHNYRRAPAVMLARQLIEQGRIGSIRHFRGSYLQEWLVDPAFPRVWRLERARAGSGALGDLASHTIDLARFLVGEIDEVCGLLTTFVPRRPIGRGQSEARVEVDVDDAALALVRFEGGAVGTIEATRFAPGRKNHNRFEVNGSSGSLAFDLERMNELELYVEEGTTSGFRRILATHAQHPYAAAWWPPGHILGYEHTFVHTVYELLRAIHEGRLPSPSFDDGLRTQRVLGAVERSAAARSWTAP
jgi:predicted dehydrogenase